MKTYPWVGVLLLLAAFQARGQAGEKWKKIAPHFTPPAEYAGKLSTHRSPLISDDGTPGSRPLSELNGIGPGHGHGLIGIRERVKVFGGEMSAGPARDGGFVVRARIPLGGDER